MKLKYQLFVVLLVASALLIALMLAVNSVSFQRQFITYVNSVEQKRLEPFIEELSATYETERSWDWINRGSWGVLMRKHSVEKRVAHIPPRHPPTRHPPPNGAKTDRQNKQKNIHPPPGSGKKKRGQPWLTLFDSQRVMVVGRRTDHKQMEWLPISYSEGTAGYLGLVRHRQLNQRLDQEFARQQRRNFIYAALAMAVLSALIAAPLASRLIRPLSDVNESISALSSGNFQYRASTARTDEFGDLARNINSLGETLEQNKAARQRWIAEISHELRTPVAVLQSEIEALQDGIRSLDADSVKSLHSETLRLGRLIDDLHQLSVSDIGALSYRMTSVDLSLLVANFLGAHKNSFEVKGIEVRFTHANATVRGDEARLNQLLDNLLQNTLRYTHAPGSLEILIKRTTDTVELIWSDSSPGVTDEDIPHLFDPLYRAEKSRNRQTSGSGLGLAIVNKIVSAHGGRATADHSDAGGLQIRISLPANINSVNTINQEVS